MWLFSMDFQMMSHASFEQESSFVAAFCTELLDGNAFVPEEIRENLTVFAKADERQASLFAMFKILGRWCVGDVKETCCAVDRRGGQRDQ